MGYLCLLFMLLVSTVMAQQPSRPTKLQQSTRLFARVWDGYFAAYGIDFAVPAIISFSGTKRSACGNLPAGNAYYCERDNTIYYDDAFLGKLGKWIGRSTGTRGEAAAVVAIAHELGHAVFAQRSPERDQLRMPYQQLNGYGQEKVADCLAGVVTRAAFEKGILDKDDLLEAEETIKVVGESNFDLKHPERPGETYPNWKIRRESYLQGFESGVNGCRASVIEKLQAQPLR